MLLKDIFCPMSLWILNYNLKSYTFWVYYILYLHVWIRIHKAPEYGSGSTTLELTHRCAIFSKCWKNNPAVQKGQWNFTAQESVLWRIWIFFLPSLLKEFSIFSAVSPEFQF